MQFEINCFKAVVLPSFFSSSKAIQISYLEDFPGSRIDALSLLRWGQKRSSIVFPFIKVESSLSHSSAVSLQVFELLIAHTLAAQSN